MGYRELGNKYAKPFGFTLLIIDPTKPEILQAFRGADGKSHVWASEILGKCREAQYLDEQLDCDPVLAHIKYFETYTVKQVDCGKGANFAFLSQAELAASFIG
jgi:hypothetical protein